MKENIKKETKEISLEQSVRNFEKRLRRIGKAENTVNKYTPNILALLKDYYKKDLSEVMLSEVNINKSQFLEFFDTIRIEKSWTPATSNMKLSAIKEFANYLEDEYGENIINCQTIKSQKVKSNKRIYMNKEQASKFWNATISETFYERDEDFRDSRLKVCIAIMLFAGLRNCEVRNLQCSDIEYENGRYTIRIKDEIAKNNTYRKTAITNKQGNEIMKQYLKDREEKLRESNVITDLLILGDELDKPLSSTTIVDMVDRVNAIEGVRIPDLTPHKLRHTFACLTYDTTKDLYLTMDLLGHSDVKTTQIYAKTLERDKKIASLEIDF